MNVKKLIGCGWMDGRAGDKMLFVSVRVCVCRMLWAAVDEVMENGIPDETFHSRRQLNGGCAQNVWSRLGLVCVFCTPCSHGAHDLVSIT